VELEVRTLVPILGPVQREDKMRLARTLALVAVVPGALRSAPLREVVLGPRMLPLVSLVLPVQLVMVSQHVLGKETVVSRSFLR